MAKDETIVVELPHEFPGLGEALPYAQELLDHFTGARPLDLHCLAYDAHKVAGFVLGQVLKHPNPVPPVSALPATTDAERAALLEKLVALGNAQSNGTVALAIPWLAIWQVVKEILDRLLGA